MDIQIQFEDDLKYESLAESLQANIVHLRSRPEHKMQFAERSINSLDYAGELEHLYRALKNSPQSFINYLQSHFSVYEVFGQSSPGQAFITSYYAPEIAGSLTKTKELSSPLYAVPDDMVFVRLDKFNNHRGKVQDIACLQKEDCPPTQKAKILRSRLVKKKGAIDEVHPYYSRQEIESKKLPAKVLAWVDPIESFFLQIQGSGFVKLPSGKKLRLGYAGQNGHRYVAIGKYLFDVIPKEKMSLQTIEQHLRSITPEKRDELLNKNPSFVFFQEITTKPVTYFGIETTDGRTIATDKRFFPKGALAFLQFKKPQFQSVDDIEPSSWMPVKRFVFDHDTGGAIKGGGRVDLFWGSGAKAKQAAGVIKDSGKLYYLLPKNLELTINKP